MKKLIFLLFAAFAASASGQEFGIKTGAATAVRGVWTHRDFSVFTGIHLAPRLRMQCEIGAVDLFAAETNFNVFPAVNERKRRVSLMIGAGFLTQIARVGRRNQINLGGGVQLTARSRLFAQADWTRYRLGGSNAGFRIALTPMFSNFSNFNDTFGTPSSEELPQDMPLSLGWHVAVFQYLLPKNLPKKN